MVSRSGHDEHFGVFGGVSTGVGAGYVVGTGFVVCTTEVVVGVSQTVGSASLRIIWNVAAFAIEAVKKASKELRSMFQAGICVV